MNKNSCYSSEVFLGGDAVALNDDKNSLLYLLAR